MVDLERLGLVKKIFLEGCLLTREAVLMNEFAGRGGGPLQDVQFDFDSYDLSP
jgi:hypothetical protein